MIFTPHISIYQEGEFDYSWFGDNITRAVLIFSKNLDYNVKLFRTRINIHLGNENRIHTNGNIKAVWIRNNFDTSREATEIDKINTVLKLIYESLIAIGKIEDWDLQAIEKAYQASIADRGKFVWYSRLKSNKKRNLKARVMISLEEAGRVPVIVQFFDYKSSLLPEVHIIDTFLHFVNWEKTFLKPAWIDNERFGYDLLNYQLLLLADSRSLQAEKIISPISLSREELEGLLRKLTYRQFSSDKEFVEWANK